jgi:hypothetical protein
MNELLREVNDLYEQSQPYVDPTPIDVNTLQMSSAKEQQSFLEMANQGVSTYQLAISKLQAVLPTLSSTEILEGYTQGCRLLQRSLSGYMGSHFDRMYLPIMVQAVTEGVPHTGATFLHVLVVQLGKEAAPLVLQSLGSVSDDMREGALVAAKQLKLVEAIPTIQGMIHDPVTPVAVVAEHVLQELNTIAGSGAVE